MSKKQTLFKNVNGFSLAEVIVVMGTLSVVGLGGMQLMDFLMKGQTSIQTTVAARDLVEDVHSLLGFSEVCALNFKDIQVGAGMAPHKVPQVIAADLTEHYKVGQKYENDSLQLQTMYLMNYTPINALNGRIDLNIELDKIKKTGTVTKIQRKVPVFVTLNDPVQKKIVTCFAQGGNATNSRNVCEDFGGRFIEADKRCVFEQLMVSDDPAFVSSPAMLHVNQKAKGDIFSVMADARVGINYPLTGAGALPANAGTSLFVNGDQRTSGKVFSSALITHKQVIAPLAEHNNARYVTPPGMLWMSDNGSATGDIGNIGMGVPWGEMWWDGGTDGFVVFSNTHNLVPTAATEFRWNYDAGKYPLPGGGGQSILTLNNDGRSGFGYTSFIDPLSTAAVIPPANGTYGGFPYANARLFVKEAALIETDLYAGGAVRAIGGVVAPSDRRWKENIRSLGESLKKVLGIQGVSYDWRKGHAPPRGASDIGFIAQEVEKFVPLAVETDQSGYKWVNYQKLIPVLWEAFKEALRESNERTDALEKRVGQLERIICLDHPDESFCVSEKTK